LRLLPLLQEDVLMQAARTGVVKRSVRVRALLCCPALSEPVADRWYLTGSEILAYAAQCFNPAEPRSSCSTRYDFHLWGNPFNPIVQWFKEYPTPLTLEALYQRLGAKQ
jgi:hypothetical protein